MSHKRCTNQYRTIHKPWTCTEKVLITIIVSLLYGIAIERNKPTIIDPCGEGGCMVHTVYASDTSNTLPTTADIVGYIAKTWEGEGVQEVFKALHVAKLESGYNVDAKGYNCRYNGVSVACKPQDRANAWSVDCGLFQHNTAGTVCPKMTWRENIDKAYKLWKRRGWQPWVASWGLGY